MAEFDAVRIAPIELQRRQPRQVGHDARRQRPVVALGRQRPGSLGQLERAWEQLVGGRGEARDPVAPQVALRTENVGVMFLGQPVGNRLQRTGAAQRDGTDPAGRLMEPVGILVVVEVAAALRRHHDLVPPFRRAPEPCTQRRVALLATPVHHRGGCRQPAVHDFVPAKQPAAVAGEDRGHAADEVALQLVDIREPLHTHPLPALRTVCPRPLVGFVAADVHDLRRKQVERFGQDLLDYGKRTLVARAIHVGAAVLRVATQLRHRPQNRRRVPWHLVFRHHGNAARGGIRHHLPDVDPATRRAARSARLPARAARACSRPRGTRSSRPRGRRGSRLPAAPA